MGCVPCSSIEDSVESLLISPNMQQPVANEAMDSTSTPIPSNSNGHPQSIANNASMPLIEVIDTNTFHQPSTHQNIISNLHLIEIVDNDHYKPSESDGIPAYDNKSSEITLSDHQNARADAESTKIVDIVQNEPFDIPYLSIFSNLSQPSNQCTDYTKCCSIQRLLCSLKYYTLLNSQDSTQNKAIFNQFIMDIYKYQMIDDFNHMTHQHGQELDQIMEHCINEYKFIRCDIDTCDYSSRHYRVSNDQHKSKNKMEPQELIYCDTLDSIHYYLFHLFQSGLRSLNTQPMDGNEKDMVATDEYYDAEFAKRVETISNTRHKTNRFDRISSNSGNKYCIKNQNNNKYNENQFKVIIECGEHIQIRQSPVPKQMGGECIFTDMDTFLDSIYQSLYDENVPIDIIEKFRLFILNEGYDSVSLELDIPKQCENTYTGNLSNYMNNMECIDVVISHLNKIRGICIFVHVYVYTCLCAFLV